MLSTFQSKLPFKLTHFSTKTLLQHKVHIGSNLTNLNSTFFRYGFFNWDITKKTVQIRLKYSLYYLKIALNLLASVIQAHGTVLVVQEHTSFSHNFLRILKQTQQPLALRPWLPGTLSNFRVLRKTYLKVFYLKRELTKHFAILYEKLNITANTKKYVQSKININKLSKELVKYVDSLAALPYVIVLGNSLHSHLAVNEARLLGIPSIGLIDSNASVFAVNYYIPWNNKSNESLLLFFHLVALTILRSQLLLRQSFLFKLAHKKQVQAKKTKIMTKSPVTFSNFKVSPHKSTTFTKHARNSITKFISTMSTALASTRGTGVYVKINRYIFISLLNLQAASLVKIRNHLCSSKVFAGLPFGVLQHAFFKVRSRTKQSNQFHERTTNVLSRGFFPFRLKIARARTEQHFVHFSRL